MCCMSINKKTALEDQMQNYNDTHNLTYTAVTVSHGDKVLKGNWMFSILCCVFPGNISHLKLAISSSSVLVSSN